MAHNDGFGLARTQRTLPIALLRAREAVMDRFRPMLSANNVTEQQWRVMRVLHESGETDAGRLADRACVMAPSLSRILRTLENRGFLQLRKDADDARRSLAALTPAGRSFLQTLTPHSVAIYEQIETALGKEQIETLLDLLETVQTELRPLAPEEP